MRMFSIRYGARYRRSLRKYIKSGNFDIRILEFVIGQLQEGKMLDKKYKDHALRGEFEGHRECHIRPDVLLMYRIEDNNLILVLVDIGSHSELF